MPITPREYKEGLEQEESRILNILEKQPHQAYTLAELLDVKTDNILLGVLSYFALKGQLDKLIGKGLVKSKTTRGNIYYISSKAI